VFGHLNDINESNEKILKLLKEHQYSEVNRKGFFYFNEQEIKDKLSLFEDELKHIVEETHKRWKDNLNAGEDVPDLMDQCLTVGKPLPKSAIQIKECEDFVASRAIIIH
jgi:hypothetical protein